MNLKLNCRWYQGYKPCKYKQLCDGCTNFEAIGVRILIIKFGAMGDALRTTPILYALKRMYPSAQITWITDHISMGILRDNPLIDQLVDIETKEWLTVLGRQFDLLISMDKDPAALALAMQIDAIHRRGFAMSPWGTPDIFNDASEYALQLGVDDELKFFRNKLTYQEIIYAMAEIPYARDPYIYTLNASARNQLPPVLSGISGSGGLKIGLNIGCGDVFATKKWPDRHFVSLAAILKQELQAEIYILGGEAERESMRKIENTPGVDVHCIAPKPLDVFAWILKEMDLIVTGDTMALHLALAVKTPVVALFGPTCVAEIDFYDIGIPIVTQKKCAPCYLSTCDKTSTCMDEMLPSEVFSGVRKLLNSLKDKKESRF